MSWDIKLIRNLISWAIFNCFFSVFEPYFQTSYEVLISQIYLLENLDNYVNFNKKPLVTESFS